MCTIYNLTYDGHDYQLRVSAQHRLTTIVGADNEEVGTIETSPCGEYFIAYHTDCPRGMSDRYHINGTTLEDVAQSLIAGGY
jgi:hypothetical protein